MWPVLTILLLAALAFLHLWWRQKLRQTEQSRNKEFEALKREHQETMLRERAQVETLFESMAEGCLLLDAAGRIQMTNRAFKELFGVNGEVRGKTVLEVLRHPELAGIVTRLATESRVLGCELKLGRDTDRFVEVNAAAVADPSGATRGAILVFHDLTRIKRLERASSDFVANVSHELRTPLSMIKGYVETLLGGAKDEPETAVKFLQTIERHSDRLALLIEDLLISSELESGRAVMNFKPVPLRPLVDKVFEDFAARAQKKSVKLLNQAPDLTVMADADRLHQVFANLVDNAIKYGRVEGCVTVGGGGRDDGGIEVFVKDDGPGLPPEAVERVFERFYRVDKARSRDQGGTGLGLSIVKDIVQAHGGRVWAESAQGQGAAFFFTLKPD
jgi:two-component system phosphate regulon sensor histidine kinase PhoR